MEKGDRKTIYYFTESYPYGNSVLWKKNELEILKKYFDVIVIPHSYNGNREARNLVAGVSYTEPLVKDEESSRLKILISVILLFFDFRFTSKIVKEIIENKVYFSLSRLRNFVGFCYMLSRLKKNKNYRRLLSQNNSHTIFYFFWGIGPVTLLPFIKECKTPAICRFLGWDLYSERHPGNYIPFQKLMLERLNIGLPCSDQGNRYLTEKFPFTKEKLITARLSTVSKVTNSYMSDGVLKIVTCSFAVPVKRLNILCQCLKKISIPVYWTHIGGGILLDDLKSEAKEFPQNVKVKFTGTVEANEIYKIYKEESFDLFLNLSESEGIPVSIMEAFAASIPAYATNVGGTSDIVDETVGKLLPSSITPQELGVMLNEYNRLSDEKKIELRRQAFARFKLKSDAVANAEEIAEIICNSINY